MADGGEISVTPLALLAFGLPAAVHAADFGDEATALEAVTLPAEAFGTIRASAAVAKAARNARDALASSLRQASQGAGFLAEAVPAAAQDYLGNDNWIASTYQAIGEPLGGSSVGAGAGLLDGGLFNVPQRRGSGNAD